jgi:hypothetical protein
MRRRRDHLHLASSPLHPVDDAFAQAIREVAEAEAVLLDANAIAVGTSLRAGQVPWRSLADLRAAGGAPGHALGRASAPATTRRLGGAARAAPEVAAVVLASRDDHATRYRGLQGGVLAIGLAGPPRARGRHAGAAPLDASAASGT